MRGPERNGLWEGGELSLTEGWQVAKQELGIQTGEHSTVCLFPSSSYRNLFIMTVS